MASQVPLQQILAEMAARQQGGSPQKPWDIPQPGGPAPVPSPSPPAPTPLPTTPPPPSGPIEDPIVLAQKRRSIMDKIKELLGGTPESAEQGPLGAEGGAPEADLLTKIINMFGG